MSKLQDILTLPNKDVEIVHKFGSADSLSTTLAPVATSKTYQTPTVAASLEIVSSDTNDNQAGTGARQVTIEGIDANWDRQTVVADMHASDGLTAEPISGTWLRVYRAYVSASGSYAAVGTPSHAGTITIRGAGGGATWADTTLISSFGLGQTLIGCYTVPRNYTAYVKNRSKRLESAKTANLLFFAREAADTVSAPYSAARVREALIDVSSDPSVEETRIGPFTGPCDIGYLAASTSTSTSVSVSYDIELIPDS